MIDTRLTMFFNISHFDTLMYVRTFHFLYDCIDSTLVLQREKFIYIKWIFTIFLFFIIHMLHLNGTIDFKLLRYSEICNDIST